jgi:hypothetical protein
VISSSFGAVPGKDNYRLLRRSNGYEGFCLFEKRLFSGSARTCDEFRDFGYGFNRGVEERIDVKSKIAGSFLKCKHLN